MRKVLRVLFAINRDIIAAIPTSRNATGIMGIIPGMATTGDNGGITGGTGGGGVEQCTAAVRLANAV